MTKASEKADIYKQDFSFCFRCGMCSSGCPVYEQFDYKPHEIPLTLTFGDIQKMLSNKTIWNCLNCLTCSERCPQGVEVAELIVGIKNDVITAGFIRDSIRVEAIILCNTGLSVPYTSTTKRWREEMNLPEPPRPNIEEIKKITKLTGFIELFNKEKDE